MSTPWDAKRIRELVKKTFNKCPCWFQIKVALALHLKKHVVAISATGSGKTLTFWIPLLMALEDGLDKLLFVVTPLNLLGKQNVNQLEEAGLSAISVTVANANEGTFP